jgi:hypothetical protein
MFWSSSRMSRYKLASFRSDVTHWKLCTSLPCPFVNARHSSAAWEWVIIGSQFCPRTFWCCISNPDNIARTVTYGVPRKLKSFISLLHAAINHWQYRFLKKKKSTIVSVCPRHLERYIPSDGIRRSLTGQGTMFETERLEVNRLRSTSKTTWNETWKQLKMRLFKALVSAKRSMLGLLGRNAMWTWTRTQKFTKNLNLHLRGKIEYKKMWITWICEGQITKLSGVNTRPSLYFIQRFALKPRT